MRLAAAPGSVYAPHVTEPNVSPPERPSLRIAELTIENFRTFLEPTVIPFSGGTGAADAIATFHGDNASGKSNAIAALDFLLRTAGDLLAIDSPTGLHRRPTTGEVLNPEPGLLWHGEAARAGIKVTRHHGPHDAGKLMEIIARFDDARLGTLQLRAPPLLVYDEVQIFGTPEVRRRLLEFRTPLGSKRRPIAILNASRRALWFDDKAPGDAIQPALAEALLATRLSREPEQRARWRDFLAALAIVPAFAGKDISIDRPHKNGLPELTFEERGKSVLGLEELSSGERQLVILFAGVLLAEASIVAVEEPELSLDAKSQLLFRDFLARLVELGRIDQAIIESHIAAFDGPQVIRFHRAPGGATRVSRDPNETAEQAALSQAARAQDAQRQWVTRDGYTELPEPMRKDLGLMQGGGPWFLKRGRWEAWPDRDVADFLGEDEPAGSDRG